MGNERSEDELTGQVLDGRYEVLERLGAGGMGVVYRARHVVLGSEVAIKVLRRAVLGVSGAVERCVREARAASAIGDPHIVDIRDFGVLPTGAPYMVMELLCGTELTALIDHEAPLPVHRACHIAAQVARALGAAHALGIVHRDLKAENVLLVPRPDTPDFVKIVDFGIAHVQNADSKITKAGELLGTPQYMSPEQCWGQPVDHRTDVYALGVLLYEMLTGGPPFTERDPRALLVAHMTSSPVPPRAHRKDLPPELDALVMRCLAKRPDLRFASMREVAEALEAMMVGAPCRSRTEGDPVTVAAPQPRSPSVRSRFLTGVLLGLVSATLCVAALAGVGLVGACAQAEARSIAPTAPASAPVAARVTAVAAPPATVPPVTVPPATVPPVTVPPTTVPPTTVPPVTVPPVTVPPVTVRPTTAALLEERVELQSDPPGAEVFDAEGTLIGNTPMAVPRPRHSVARYRLERTGFRPRSADVGPATQDVVSVSMTRALRRSRAPLPRVSGGSTAPADGPTHSAIVDPFGPPSFSARPGL